MARVKVNWKQGVWAEIRTLPTVMLAVDEVAADIKERAGEGYVQHVAAETGGKIRGRAAISTGDYESIRDNAKNNTLVKSLRGGG